MNTEKDEHEPIDLTAVAEAVSAYRCTECQEIQEESHGPVYECGNCGTTFSKEDEGSHRCPDCNKFAGKLADDSIDCGCNAKAEEVIVYACEECDEFVPEDDAKTHECRAAPSAQPTAPVEAKQPFALGQRVRIKPAMTSIVIHTSLGALLDPPQRDDVPCYGPAKVMGYYTTKPQYPNLPQDLVALRCEAHNYDAGIHADCLEEHHDHTWGAGELSGGGFDQCGVCFRVRRTPTAKGEA